MTRVSSQITVAGFNASVPLIRLPGTKRFRLFALRRPSHLGVLRKRLHFALRSATRDDPPSMSLSQAVKNAVRFLKCAFIDQLIELREKRVDMRILLRRIYNPLKNIVGIAPFGRDWLRSNDAPLSVRLEQPHVPRFNAADDLRRMRAYDELAQRKHFNQQCQNFPLPSRMQVEFDLIDADQTPRLGKRGSRKLQKQPSRQVDRKQEVCLLAAG